MNTFAELLSHVVTTLQSSEHCAAVRILETHVFSADQFAFKLRADLISDDVLQIRIYRNRDHVDYSYQLLRSAQPVMRWDNKEHFPQIASHPHHFHDAAGEVKASPLTGEVAGDLAIVLNALFPGSQ